MNRAAWQVVLNDLIAVRDTYDEAIAAVEDIVKQKEQVAPVAQQEEHRPSKPKRTGSSPVGRPNPHAVALGRLGGVIGGPARAEVLSAERRSEIARDAANKRWGK